MTGFYCDTCGYPLESHWHELACAEEWRAFAEALDIKDVPPNDGRGHDHQA